MPTGIQVSIPVGIMTFLEQHKKHSIFIQQMFSPFRKPHHG